MVNLTVSTYGATPRGECHAAEDISVSRLYAGGESETIVTLALNAEQALGVAFDLLWQIRDAGLISGWNVQFPERA